MSSLWTPSGEHKVPREGNDTGPAGSTDSTGGTGGPPPMGGGGEDVERAYPSPDEEQAIKEQLAELSQRLASAPPEEIVANHAYGLFELAAIHLSRKPPNLPAARLAIDALAALVDTLKERLGVHTPSLLEALSQIRLAYVQIATANPGAVHPEAEAGGDVHAEAGEPAVAEAEGASEPEG